MEKLIYLVWAQPEAGDALRDRVLGEVAPQLLGHGVHRLALNVHDRDAAVAPSPVPTPAGELPHLAQVSVWVDSYDRRGALDDVVATLGERTAGYLVTESLYDDYGTTPHSPPRDWPDGARSPGVLTVALIHRPQGLDYDEWIRRWHGTQSPLSAELQPRARYVRNEVVRAITVEAPEVDGIVEEAWPSVEDVADPMRFFNAGGDQEVLTRNRKRMFESVEACLDLARLRNVTMSEYLIRT